MSGQRCGAGVYGSELVCHGVCVWCVCGVSVCRVCSCVFAFSVKEENLTRTKREKSEHGTHFHQKPKDVHHVRHELSSLSWHACFQMFCHSHHKSANVFSRKKNPRCKDLPTKEMMAHVGP